MMKIDIDSSKLEKLDAYLAQKELRFLRVASEIAALSSVLIQSRMQSALGSKAGHFRVEILPEGMNIGITVGPVDDIGNFLFHGTKAHLISSPSPMFLGGGVFAQSVMHPGTESIREELDAIVSESVMYAANVVAATL